MSVFTKSVDNIKKDAFIADFFKREKLDVGEFIKQWITVYETIKQRLESHSDMTVIISKINEITKRNQDLEHSLEETKELIKSNSVVDNLTDMRAIVEGYMKDTKALVESKETENIITNKLTEMKSIIDQYMNDTKELISNKNNKDDLLENINKITESSSTKLENTIYKSVNDVNENIKGLAQDNNTQSILREIEKLSQNTITQLENTILKELQQFSKDSEEDKNRDKLLINSMTQNLETINSHTITKLENVMLKNINISSHVDKLEMKIDNRFDKQELIMNDINNIFTHNSSVKGRVSEDIMEDNLNDVMPEFDIVCKTQDSQSGDFLITRDNYPHILLELKTYTKRNVPKVEIDKFHRDIRENNCCGILANTHAKIANKQHFEIERVADNFVIYIHTLGYNAHTIKIATNILQKIYHLCSQLPNNTIDNHTFDIIKLEYNNFMHDFKKYIRNIKLNLDSLLTLHINTLDILFNNVVQQQQQQHTQDNFQCDICGKILSTQPSLSRHKAKLHKTFPDNNDSD